MKTKWSVADAPKPLWRRRVVGGQWSALAVALLLCTGCGLFSVPKPIATSIAPATSKAVRHVETEIPAESNVARLEVTVPPHSTGSGQAIVIDFAKGVAIIPSELGASVKGLASWFKAAAKTTEHQEAKGAGMGLTTSNPDVAEFNSPAPAATVGPSGPVVTPSPAVLHTDAPVLPTPSKAGILFVIGAAVVLLGGVGGWLLRQYLLGGVVAGCGAALIGLGVVAEKYPWAFLVAGGVGLVLLGVVVWHFLSVASVQKTLAVTVAGVEDAKKKMDEPAKASLAASLNDAKAVASPEAAVIDKVKETL